MSVADDCYLKNQKMKEDCARARAPIGKFVPLCSETRHDGKTGMALSLEPDKLRMFGCFLGPNPPQQFSFGSYNGKPVNWTYLPEARFYFTTDFSFPFNSDKSFAEVITIDEWRTFRNAYAQTFDQLGGMIKEDDPYYRTYLDKKSNISNLDGYIYQREIMDYEYKRQAEEQRRQDEYNALKRRLDQFDR